MRHVRLLIPLIGLLAAISTVQTIESLYRRDQEGRAAIAARADQILHVKLPQVRYDQLPFREALEDYARLANLPLQVDWDVLQAKGIDPGSPVTSRLYNVKAGKGLSVLLDSVSRPAQRLDFVVAENGTIEIVPDRIGPERAVIDVYDISDLFIHVPKEPGPAIDESERSKTQAELIHDVTQLITDTVATDSWESNGGTIGRIHFFHGKLLITQTPAGHRSICNLLEQLREMRWSNPERRRLEMRLLYDEEGDK